jgi:hypothetical protein
MGLSNSAPHFDDSQLESPFYLSLYVLDSLKNGTIFDPSTYTVSRVENWVYQFTEKIAEMLPFPKNLQKETVQKRMWDKFVNFSREDKYLEKLDSIDVNNEKSIESFLRENREKTTEKLEEMEEFLKQEEFPPFLWMEYDRFCRIHSEISSFFEKLILKIFAFRPKRTSQMRERNKQMKTTSRIYFDLIEAYFQALSGYLRLFVFMEVWSCNNEEDLFTSECIWSFKKIDPTSFEYVFLDFHNSINLLRQAFFRFKPQEARIDISKPTDWAFKQLILMT